MHATSLAAGAPDTAKRTLRAADLPPRSGLFAALCVLGFANGSFGRILGMVDAYGVGPALLRTFDISAVVWLAFLACPGLLLRSPGRAPDRADLAVAACAAAAFLLPVGPASWVALTGLGLYLVARPDGPSMRGAGWILLAIAGAMFWGRVLLMTATAPILLADAVLIGWLTGSEQVGNTIRFVDGSGYVWIEAGCSSLANVSLAVLCWTLFAQWRGVHGRRRNIGWCLAACIGVVAINVSRISLMVLRPGQFELIHGPVGQSVAVWLTIGLVVALCAIGTRHGRLAPA